MFKKARRWLDKRKRVRQLMSDDETLNRLQLTNALRWGDEMMKAANLSRQARRQLFRDAAHDATTLSDLVLYIMRRATEASK